MIATLTDHCPCLDTEELRALLGPTAGPTGPDGAGWKCVRCGLEATDLANAQAYRQGPLNDGYRLDLMYEDAIEGRPVEPIAFARAVGRYYCRLNPDGALDADGLLGMLSEIAFQLRLDLPDDAPNPWRNASDFDAARMLVAALNAAGYGIVEVAR